MTDIEKLVRENVRELIPYSCARDEFQGKEGIFMDANENPYGTLNRYPDPYQRELKSAISKIKNVPEENIFLGNGSDEIIDLCFRIFCNPGIDKVLTFSPSYGMYEVSAAINDVKLIKIPLSDEFNIDIKSVLPVLKDPKLKLIFICSPNNPTGNSMKKSDIETIISGFNGIVVIDEAYIDFSERPSFKTLISRHRNLIVMQTFSKAMGLAAARVGMAFMDPSNIQYFNKMKPPYNISAINQKEALKCLTRIELLKNRVTRIKTERERLAENLKKLAIIEKVFPSDSNFLLVKTRNADLIYSKLIDNKIIVRNRNKIVPGCIRITVGTINENNKLIEALRKIKL
jgi:histidinol-phosphate aminotransferase